MMLVLFKFLVVSLLSWSTTVTKAIETAPSYTCHWNRSDNTPHVYWINMEKSVERRLVMTKHLDEVFGVGKHTRFRALTMDEIYVPKDIASTWMSYNVPWTTKEYENVIPLRDRVTPESKFWPYRVILSTLFGRRKTNKLKEIGCTISHLFAIYQAVHETKSTSKYALIIEDDVHFLFNIDWDALAATAPKDFGILQLFNSNKDTLTVRWDDYLAKKKKGVDFLWIEKWPRQPIGNTPPHPINTPCNPTYPINIPCKHTLSTPPANTHNLSTPLLAIRPSSTPYNHILSSHSVNTLPQYTLSNTPYQHLLSTHATHPINTPCKHTYPINTPYQQPSVFPSISMTLF